MKQCDAGQSERGKKSSENTDSLYLDLMNASNNENDFFYVFLRVKKRKIKNFA